MSGNAQRLAEAANQITNPQPIEEAKQLGTVAPFNYNMELLKAMSADEDGKVKFAVSGFMLRIYGKSPSPDLVNFFKKVLNDAGRQYKIVAQSRFDVQYMTPKDTSGLFHGGFEGITVDTGSLIASNKELLDRFGKSVYDAVRKQFTSNSVQVGGAYAGTTSGGFNYGKGLGLSGIDIVRSMSPKGSIMGEAANQINNPKPIKEAYKAGDTVKVPHKGKMVKGKIVRYDDGGSDKARQSGGGYVVDVGEPASILVPANKVVKEAAEQIDELSKMRRLGQTVGAIIHGKPTPSDRLKDAKDKLAYKRYMTPERKAKEAEIDAKIRKLNAAVAIEEIKRIIDDHYDKEERAMIISGIKSIKESAEITE
jgi:hypothetical protein